ncbi:hypothetical protein TcBrA4_0047640 [Trypanosoma cruzi]|nr:hypothetical protein TcBrA4_0047640 [Trypanosoma cruzi]
MRRVTKHANAAISTMRWLWTLHDVAACPSIDVLRLHMCQRAQQETEWDLDFALLSSLNKSHAPNEVLRCCCAAMSSAAHSVERIAVTVTSAAVVGALARVLCSAQVESLRTLHLTLHEAAFLRDDLALATLLRSTAHFTSNLNSLCITMVACDMQHGLQWNQKSLRALAANIPSLALRVLSLEYINLKGANENDLMVLCEAIAHCHLLTHLSLRGTRGLLPRVPLLRFAVAQMRELEVLDLSSTLLGDVVMEQLVDTLRVSIGGWYRLRQLNLLETNVSVWGLRRLLRDVGEMSHGETAKIELLNFSSNSMDDEGAFVLASVCMHCGMLRELHLRHNRLTKKGAADIGSALIAAASLRCLNLHSNPLSDEGLFALLQYANYWPELRSLDFTRCRLTARCLPALCAALPLFDRLEEISLDRNDLRVIDAGDASPTEYKRETPEGDLPLFAYDPKFMQGGSRGDWKVSTSFELDRRDAIEGRRRFKGTETFRTPLSSRKSIGGVVSFEQLGLALSGCRELGRLSLSSCSLTDDCFLAMAGALVVRRLTHLDLSANPLFTRMESLEALAKLLRRASASMQKLDLSCTGLGSVGASLLVDGSPTDDTNGDADEAVSALRSLTALTELRFSSCRIGAEGFEAIADAFPAMTLLERVFLDGNAVQKLDAILYLLSALEALPSLRFVGLYGSVPPHLAATVGASREYAALQSKGVVVHHL